MSPFEAKGDRARWRIVYELLRPLDVGDVITYRTLADALDLHHEADRHAIQMAMRRAAREFETQDQHAVESVPNQGYRVVDVPEHLILAKKQQKRAGRALERGHSKVVNVDLSSVEPEVRSAFQVVAQAFAMQMDMNRRLEGRQSKVEAAVAEIAGRSDRSEAEVAALRARLERLEAQIPHPED